MSDAPGQMFDATGQILDVTGQMFRVTGVTRDKTVKGLMLQVIY